MYQNPSLIQQKVESAFSEFTGKFDPVLLYQALLDLCTLAVNVPQVCTNITTLVGEGDDALEAMDVSAMELGTAIVIQYQGSFQIYILTANDLATVAPYIIKANNGEGDARSWARAGSLFGTFTNEDLTEEYLLFVTHGLGFPYCNVLIFNANNEYQSNISFHPAPENPNMQVAINIGSGFEGTWKVLIAY